MTLTTNKFGAYEILYELKSGGMGAVLLGRRRGPGAFEQLVAIKTIRPEYANAESVRAMFLDEAAILARCGHPAVASVYDFGEEGGTLYMAMEYVAGIAFRDLHRLPPTIVARAIAEACRGVHAAHEMRDLHGNALGLVHRDISPDNLMLGFDGHVKVIDFGIALVKNRQAPVTEFGTVKGKPPYMSPEQVKNEPIDRKSDVFSLGVVMWEMLTGEQLFDGDSLYAIAFAVDSKEIVPPSRLAGQLPIGFDAVVMNALDRKLASRTPTAAALAEQLEAVVQEAGEETLEAWADRELKTKREEHRAWLSGVVGGGVQLPKAIGRPSSSVTQLAPEQGVPPQPLALAATPVHEPQQGPAMSTHLAADESPPVPPRRRVGLAIIAALLLVAIGGLVLLLVQPHNAVEPKQVDAKQADAKQADATKPDATIVADAPPDAPSDAAIAIDAAVTVHHDARTVAHDAPPKPIDAPPAVPALTGTGIVTITATPYAHIKIDGADAGDTPKYKKPFAAGRHTFEFTAADDGHSRGSVTITLHDGETIQVDAPKP